MVARSSWSAEILVAYRMFWRAKRFAAVVDAEREGVVDGCVFDSFC